MKNGRLGVEVSGFKSVVAGLGAVALAVPALAAAPATEWAREEFVTYATKVFGQAPEVRFVLPGETDDFADDFAALKDTDGYAVRRRDGKLVFVADNPKGHVNGVHRWLERNSDIVWPRPKGDLCFCTRQSNSRTVEQSDSDYRDIPTFRLRVFGGGCKDTEVWRYLVRNAMSSPVGATAEGEALDDEARRYGCLGAFCDMTPQGHDMERRWFPRKEFFKDHPEYWMLVDGVRWTGGDSNFCETNPGFVEAFSKSVEEKILKLPPTVKIVSVNMEDTRRTCQCENCQKPIRLADGTEIGPDDPAFASTRFFIFFNQVARHVAKVRPGTTILQFAYLHLAIPPKVPIEPNLELKFCPYPRNMREPVMGGPSNADWQKRVEGWLALTPNLYWREYYFCGCIHYPRPMGDSAAIDLREVARRGVKDVYTDSPCRNGDNDKLMRGYGLNRMNREYFDMNAVETWVIQRLFWDPSQDPKALRADFIRRTFGPAAPDVAAFYRILDDAWYSDDLPSRFCDSPAQSAAHYIVAKGNAGRCRAALAAAAAKADNDARREWIANMRRVLDDWIADAATYVTADFDVPESADATAAVPFPVLRTLRDKNFQDASGSRFTIRSDGSAFVIGLEAKTDMAPQAKTKAIKGVEAFPAGDKAELFFSVPGNYVQFAFDCEGRRYDAKGLDSAWTGAWTVRTEKGEKGWTATVRIPFATLGFEPQKDPRIRFLPMLTIRDAHTKVRNYSWLGGVPHTPVSWGTLRVNIR